MKKLIITLSAAAVCGTASIAAEGVAGFAEVGPGVFSHNGTIFGNTKISGGQYGGQATAGVYLGESDLGAFRLAGTAGAYYSNGGNSDSIKRFSAPFLASAAYEFNLSPVRLRVGPAAGFTYINWDWTERHNYGWFSVTYDVNVSKAYFTYGGLAGLSVDLTDNVYLAADYKYLCVASSDVKGYNGHVVTLGVGFNF